MKISLPAIVIALGGVVSVVALVSGVAAGCGARASTSSSAPYVAASTGDDDSAQEGAKQPFSLDAGVVIPMPDAGVGAFPLDPSP
ncbi:hypothetical protein [Sandaracinus amylolyticus]|uniref:hypothetical protein n=1 Tax=Sandaracinus amylolyticus TaxID=927083 RepID=UPI001F249D26|nr:hypothetical protein [Sandaracinus amylolyticus]UJR84635.1 Hypothetical protein I5071_67140 [Sandaracinus amylolyticus]